MPKENGCRPWYKRQTEPQAQRFLPLGAQASCLLVRLPTSIVLALQAGKMPALPGAKNAALAALLALQSPALADSIDNVYEAHYRNSGYDFEITVE
jgi:hypothetical protein